MAIDKSKMKCNKPKRQISGGKKFVVKACKGGKEKIIRFGDANMTIKKRISLQEEKALELDIDVLLLKISSAQDIGAVKNGNIKEKTMYGKKNEEEKIKRKKQKEEEILGVAY